MAFDHIGKLDARANADTRELLGMIRETALSVKGSIVDAKDVQHAMGRERLYREVAEAYHELGGKMDGVLKECAAATAMASAKAVGQSLVGKAKEAGNSILKFSMERAKRYWRYVCPENSRGLAAASTDKMGADLIDTLRRAVVEVERQAAIEGWTMDEIRKGIEDKWAEASKNDKNFMFVDKSGRAWENGRYCQMLARTTATRVWNDSYLDRLAEEGFNLVKVSQHGSEPDCDVCRAWNGVICVISGKSEKYPTVEEAKAAGVFHPNCMCTWEYVDEDEDKAEIDKQGKGGKVDWNDPEAVEKHRNGERAESAEERAAREKKAKEDADRAQAAREAKVELRAKFPANFPEKDKHVFDNIRPEVAIKYAEAVKGIEAIEGDASMHNEGVLKIAPGDWNHSKLCYIHEAGHAVFRKINLDARRGEGLTDIDWGDLHMKLTPAGQRLFDALTDDAEKFFDANGGTRKQNAERDCDWARFDLDTITRKIFGAGNQFYKLGAEEKHLVGAVTDTFQAITDSAFMKGSGHEVEYYRDSRFGTERRLNEPFANLSELLAMHDDEHARNALSIFPKAAKIIGEFYGIKGD